MEKLESVKFSDYSNYTCVNDAYQDFGLKFLFVIDFVAQVRTLRAKYNTKPWFDVNVLDVIWNHDKRYKKLKRWGKEIDEDKCAKLLLKKTNNKKKLYFEEKIAENRNNPKKLLRTLKSLGMPSKEGRQSKISLKENNVVSFNSKDNANTFCRFFSNLPNSNFESKLLRSIIRRFEMNVRILFYNSW